MRNPSKKIFFGETSLAIACAGLALLSAVWPDWIEELSGFEPDNHDGSVEWLVVLVFAAVALVSGLLARTEWRRLKPA